MPTNLPIEAIIAQREYEEACLLEEKIKKLEVFLSKIPQHKGTEKLRGGLRLKLSKLKKQIEKRKQVAKARRGAGIRKEGAGRAVFVGCPNSGKSSLLNACANMKLMATSVPFETDRVAVGTIIFEDAKIQVLEIPSFMKPSHLSYACGAELVVFVIDASIHAKPQFGKIMDALRGVSVLVNKPAPGIKVVKKSFGGISFVGKKLLLASVSECKRVLQDRGVHNAEVIVFKKSDFSDFLCAFEEAVRVRGFIIATKCDSKEAEKNVSELCGVAKGFEILRVSFTDGKGVERIPGRLWANLGRMRIYAKTPGKKADKDKPIILDVGGTIREFLPKIHKDFLERFRFARVWRKNSIYNGRQVGTGFALEDKDVVQVHI